MRTNTRLSALFIALSTLSSCCFQDPAYQGEVSVAPGERWIPPTCLATPSATMPKTEFPDEEEVVSVDQLVGIALENNPETSAMWAAARQAAFAYRASKSECLPQVNLTESLIVLDEEYNDAFQLGGTGSFGNASGLSGSNSLLASELVISYLLLDFGGRSATIQAAYQALMASNWSYNRLIQTVIVNVLNSYYNYENAVAMVKAKEKDLEDALANFEAADRMYRAGIKTHVDEMQAQSNVVDAELKLVQAEGDKTIAMGALVNVLGLPANTKLRVTPLPEELPHERVEEDVENLMLTAEIQRPDLAAERAKVKQACAEYKIARSDGMPTVTGIGDLQKNAFFHAPNQNSRITAYGLQLQWPIFQGFYFVNKRRQALAAIQEAEAELANQELNVQLDVLTSYTNFQTAVESVKFSESYLAFTEQAYEATFLSYKSGIASIQDLFNAQKTLSDARAQLIQSRTDWMTALAEIAYTTGTL